MVSKSEVSKQLKKIGFNSMGWGRTEVSELHNILLPDEEIYECVNGMYEGGFALLVATDLRVLLIDKKPLSFLTVEDMRFDMINEMDYNHRLLGADISISSGGKNLRFRSYNKHKLRKLIGHLQHCIAESKKKQTVHQDDQVSHLEQINKQLQTYLIAQHQYQTELQKSIKGSIDTNDSNSSPIPTPPKPSNELADYLYAKSLIDQYSQTHNIDLEKEAALVEVPVSTASVSPSSLSRDNDREDIYNEGMREIFGASSQPVTPTLKLNENGNVAFNINPTRIAFSKLPMALRHRKFSNPSAIKSAPVFE